jgi:predicted permease
MPVSILPIFLDSRQYSSGEASRNYYRKLFERLANVPGVVAVGGATTVPSSPLGPDFDRPVWPEGSGIDPSQRMSAAVRMVTPGYFSTLGVSIADGRAFDDRDHPTSIPVAMINETLAKRLFPGERAVGRRMVVDYSTAGTFPYEIVGIAGDVRFRGPRSEPVPEVYFPHAQRSYLIMNVVLKSSMDPQVLVPTVRAVLKEVDPQKPAHGFYPLQALLGATFRRDRQAMTTLLVFAGTAIFLAILSVYGVLTQRVRERTREIGIRLAMGANASHLVGWVARAGVKLMATGLAAGLFVAPILVGWFDDVLFQVPPTDIATLLGVVLALAVVGLIATLVPAWRASRIDPVTILKQE